MFTLYVDPFCKELDKSDARYWFCTEMLPDEEYEAKYGKKYLDFAGGDEWKEWRGEKTRRVAEYWWKEDEDVTYYKVNRNGQEGK